MQQQQMFTYDQEVLISEQKTLIEKKNSANKNLETTLGTMIQKLESIQYLNNQAKKNDIFKEKLHQTLREYLSWKNSLFKQNFIQKQACEVNFARLFNFGKKYGDNEYENGGQGEDNQDTEPDMDKEKQEATIPQEQSGTKNNRNLATRQNAGRKGKFKFYF